MKRWRGGKRGEEGLELGNYYQNFRLCVVYLELPPGIKLSARISGFKRANNLVHCLLYDKLGGSATKSFVFNYNIRYV